MRVLVAHDGSTTADKALSAAIDVTGKLGGSLDIVTVIPDLCLSSEEISPDDCELVSRSMDAEARGRMRKVSESLAARGMAPEIIVKTGRPADKIIEAAEERKADMIVVGSEGRHGSRKHLGSVSSRVADLAGVNVLIVR